MREHVLMLTQKQARAGQGDDNARICAATSWRIHCSLLRPRARARGITTLRVWRITGPLPGVTVRMLVLLAAREARP